ncbi:MAG: ATP-dependent zinc metalloprotease FtsH [Candidatus Eisenbacteria bacterium]
MDEKQKPKQGGKNKLELPRSGGGKRGYRGDGKMGAPRRGLKGGLAWVVLFLITLVAVSVFWRRETGEVEILYSELRAQIAAANIASITIDVREVHGEFKDEIVVIKNDEPQPVVEFKTWLTAEDPDLPDKIWAVDKGVDVGSKGEKSNWGGFLLTTMVPILFLIGIMILLMRQMEAGGNRAFSFGRSRAKLITGDRPKVTFEDVAGADEAKEELQEIIEFLRDPRKFQKLGGRIPKGALLLGAPGTGKTLLAKAVAGEAEVPFFSISGSDFVEMFVGVGASRVRDLFEQGKKQAPCIIFIDEIDAVGRHRGAGLGGGHDEREQTLNQLLVEMDGFESNDGVILLAATNRPDVLDPALLRPGRFDRQIVVDMPDINGREGILKVHTRKIPLADDVELRLIARGTPGLSGADLENIVNEAALLAARRDRKSVMMTDFEEAKDKVMMGPERKSLLISEEEKERIAYHEAGHALVASLIPEADPLHKVTIVPRGQALGMTAQLPIDDRHNFSRTMLMAELAVFLGGRAAEKEVFNELTTGAKSDIDKATEVARKMVCEWGMSDNLGPLSFGRKEEQIFLGREIAQHRDYSEKTALLIDKEVRLIVDTAEERAEKLISDNIDGLKNLASALLEKEILDRDEIDRVLRGEKLEPAARKEEAADEAAVAESRAETPPQQPAGPPPKDERADEPAKERG